MSADTLPNGRDDRVPLMALRFGHDPLAGADINARSSGRTDGIPELANMLKTQGLIRPLLVVENPTGKEESKGLYFAFAGNRRLAALQTIHAPDDTIPVKVYDKTAPLYELSIADNEAVLPHAVDRFRSFVELIKRDKVPPAAQPQFIAKTFGMTDHDARKALALGALDDSILDAWRAGDITADQAKVFTLIPDKKAQAKMFAAKCKNHWELEISRLRSAILGKKEDAAKLVAFVGADAYRAAGGSLTEDLFGSNHVVHDVPLAKRLADEKLAEFCNSLRVDAGWAWAEPEETAPQGWQHGRGWGRLDKPKLGGLHADEKTRLAAARKLADDTQNSDDYEQHNRLDEDADALEELLRLQFWKPADKAKSGCFVGICESGRVMVHAGVMKPEEKKAVAKEEKKKAAKKSSKSGEPNTSVFSAALATRLSTSLTVAAANVVAGDSGETALRLLLAGFATDGYGGDGPVCVKQNGMGNNEIEGRDITFAAALAELEKVKPAALQARLCRVVASALDMRSHSATRMLSDKDEGDGADAGALVNFLPQKELQAELRKAFNAADYFESAPSAFSRAALADMSIEVPKGVTKAKALAEIATEHAKRTGWLPPQLRTKGYAGPSSVPAKKAPGKAAKPARKAAKKRR